MSCDRILSVLFQQHRLTSPSESTSTLSHSRHHLDPSTMLRSPPSQSYWPPLTHPGKGPLAPVTSGLSITADSYTRRQTPHNRARDMKPAKAQSLRFCESTKPFIYPNLNDIGLYNNTPRSDPTWSKPPHIQIGDFQAATLIPDKTALAASEARQLSFDTRMSATRQFGVFSLVKSCQSVLTSEHP